MKSDDSAQIHILEMLTLFWLFFMSATFLIQIQVPDAPSVGISANMEFAGQDAVRYGLGTPAQNGDYDSRLAELLATNQLDEACELIQDALANGIEGNCWLAKDSGTSSPHGEVANPNGRTIAVHSLVPVDENLWTVSLDVWTRGGGD
ncbi:MAG: hypothetical protein ACKVIR_02280 [Candidatus Poseidoniales archaeon]|jgi:hypothetical protein